MRCIKCQGTMVHERFFTRGENFWAWRCVNCGQILDEFILNNRQQYGKKLPWGQHKAFLPLARLR